MHPSVEKGQRPFPTKELHDRQGSISGEKVALSVMRSVISEEHANFILNVGGATSSDVRALVNLIKNAVFSQYGIALEEEIRYIDN